MEHDLLVLKLVVGETILASDEHAKVTNVALLRFRATVSLTERVVVRSSRPAASIQDSVLVDVETVLAGVKSLNVSDNLGLLALSLGHLNDAGDT